VARPYYIFDAEHAFTVLPDMAAASKYKLAFTALSLMLGWFAFTLYFEIDHYTWVDTLPNQGRLTVMAFSPVVVEQWQTPAERYYNIIARYLPYITMLYLAGLVFNTLRMILAWNNIYRIRQNIIVADLQQQVHLLAQQMGITKYIQAAYSQLINVPCITGFFRPVILLPLGISSYLTAQEIEAILLHELAHIKRNDYLLNLIQQVIGIVLFFNPFSRLISR
jgi:bla regulator protein BlaR1